MKLFTGTILTNGRDLKPANILCDVKGNFYITDFNCSISLKERIPNSKAGSLEYMGNLN